MNSADETEVGDLRRRLDEAEETLRAIRVGEVDALVVDSPEGPRVFTLQGADHPYRTLIEGMQQGAASLTGEGVVLYCNRCFASMVRRPHEKVIGALVIDFFPNAVQSDFTALLRAGATRTTYRELEVRADDGTLLPVSVALSPLPLAAPATLCMLVTDLTEHKKNEDLQQIVHRKDEFLAMLGHELRNPLAGIMNGIEVLDRLGANDDEAEAMRAVIRRQATQMINIVSDLLDVTRITRGKVVLKKESLDLAGLVRDVAEDHRQNIENRGATLRLVMPAAPVWCDGDRTRISQVVANLLTNAAKFTDETGDVTVEVWGDAGKRRAVVRVRDTGIGMESQTLRNIFLPFVQAERTLDRSRGGLGLGLALVKGLVELHGGRVVAASPGVGRGSEFTVELPAGAAPSAGAAAGPRLAGVRRRVLLIDDRRDAILPAKKMLELAGHEVFTAGDGPSGIALARKIRPDVVLCDIGLPDGMSGFDVASTLRQDPDLQNVYLVAVSGYGQEHDRQSAREAGFDNHLTKPVGTASLEMVMASFPRFAEPAAK